MLRSTGFKLLTFICISFFTIAIGLGGCVNKFVQWVSGPDISTVYVYSDMPADMILNSFFLSKDTAEDNAVITTRMDASSSPDSITKDMPIFVNDYKKYSDTFENKKIVGYYSLAFLTSESNLDIAQEMSAKSDYHIYVIDFNKILKGFMEDKTYKDIGYDSDEKIDIKAVYGSKNDIYYKLIESQILYELTGITNQTQEDFDNNRVELDKVMNKIEKFTANEYDKHTIYLVCEQSYSFRNMRQHIYPCYEYYMACEPLYMMYNGTEWDETFKSLTEGSYRGVNIAATARFRTPLDTSHSTASYNGNYRNVRALDSVNKILRDPGT